jgi:lipoprotein-releasing system permease protein
LNLERYISKKILSKDKSNFSRPVIRLAILSIALGLSVMILSVSIVVGFQKAVRQKVSSFDAHIQISGFSNNESYEQASISRDQEFLPAIAKIEGVKNIQVYAQKGGILKANKTIQGVMMKGVGSDYDWSNMEQWLIAGKIPIYNDSGRSKEIVISKNIANKIQLHVGDPVLMYFIQEPPRVRKFYISGIYHSGLEEFDSRYIIGDIQQIQKLNKWDKNQIAGFEVMIDNYDDMEEITAKVNDAIGYDLIAKNIRQRYPFIMDWLNLLDTNVYFILGLMVLISGITMMGTILILILEKTNMIGTLKALGSNNKSIRKIFIYNALYLIGSGLLLGNILGISLAAIQYFFKIIPLDPDTYYMDTIPIYLNFWYLLALNIGTILITTLMMLWPSHIVSRISPIKALRFD